MLELVFLMLGAVIYGFVWIIDIICVVSTNDRDARRFRGPVMIEHKPRSSVAPNCTKTRKTVHCIFRDDYNIGYESEQQKYCFNTSQDYYNYQELQLDNEEWLENQDPEFYDEYVDDLGFPNEYYEY